MKEFVAYIVKNLVDHRDQVSICETEGAQGLIIELTVEKTDIGKVIGKRGRTIRAIRTLLMSVASRHGVRVNLEVIEEGRKISSEQEDMLDVSNSEPRVAISGASELADTNGVAPETSGLAPEISGQVPVAHEPATVSKELAPESHELASEANQPASETHDLAKSETHDLATSETHDLASSETNHPVQETSSLA